MQPRHPRRYALSVVCCVIDVCVWVVRLLVGPSLLLAACIFVLTLSSLGLLLASQPMNVRRD
jgi:hypothetical protein